jgi:hypothetical protein
MESDFNGLALFKLFSNTFLIMPIKFDRSFSLQSLAF